MTENAERFGHRELFLFEDRVLSHIEVNRRVDNVVRGFIACGVRPGEHVGVMMETRPSALVAIAALSRLGAVVVPCPRTPHSTRCWLSPTSRSWSPTPTGSTT